MEYADQPHRRATAGDALAKAFEMVATPALFALGGWLVDQRLDTFPLVALTAGLVVLVYQMWRVARDYSADLDKALDARRAGYDPARQAPHGAP